MLRCWCISVITLIVFCHIELSHEELNINKCPIGFKLSYTESKEDPICYRLKEPEYFEDVYEDCIGNLFSLRLYQELNFTKLEHSIWTEYRSYYPGGLFVDTSYTKSFGNGLNLTNVTFNNLDIDEEWCIIIDPVINFSAVKCNEKHHRYCFVKPYQDVVDMSSDDCSDFKSFRFRSPESTCITALEGVGGGAIRATWSQARKLCSDRGGSLLYRGWRYANSPILKDKTILPLGVIMSTDSPWLRYDALNDRSEVPRSKWHFAPVNNTNYEESFGAQRNYLWYLVNSSYVFYDVACEHSVPLANLSMHITSKAENKLILSINETIDRDDIMCYTDALGPYPLKISKKRKANNTYVLNESKNGYYWCTHKDILNFEPAETNKVLYIRDARSLKNVYAIKFRLNETYPVPSTLHRFDKGWSLKLREYLFYKSQYEKVNGELDLQNAEDVLKIFKQLNPGLEVKSLSLESNVKRLYIDYRTILVHAALDPDIGIVSPGTWDGMEVLSMKSVYYCAGFDSVPDTPLGQSVNATGCRTHTCVGDFNEGVQWVTTATVECTTIQLTTINRHFSFDETNTTHTSTFRIETTDNNTQNSSESSEETTDLTPNATMIITTELTSDDTTADCETLSSIAPGVTDMELTTFNVVITPPLFPPFPPKPTTIRTTTPAEEETTTDTPTTTPLPPEEKLQQVLDNLEGLVNNDSHIFVADISDVFDQVDVILEQHDDLDIPAQFLHLLDQLGSTVMLNQTRFGSAIRPNIALLMADAEPNNPVRGFRIATSDSDQFTDTTFEFIAEEPNSTVLNSGESEVVVNLPLSVSESHRRVSFVVFRNDRAFHAESVYVVNSRVLSVNIENVTHFTGGEVIDIHLNPIVTELERNESRSCAYWQFVENGTGYWSQEGCIFIPATEQGMLDTCRCDHLTHFAEVLVPRAVFSEANEQALEIITIVGCFLSLFGLLMIGVTALLFRSWRREYSNKIWLQLCIAIFVLVLSFLFVIFIHFDHYDIACLLIGVTLHYSVLASFCWMLVAAVLAYRKLVLVFSRDASHKLLKAAAFSWGAPCVVVGILLSVSPKSYVGRFEEMTPSGSFCYPSGLGLWLTVYAPIAAILLTNWILFVLIVRSVFVSRRIQRHGETNDAIRCASVSCMLVFLFGLPWIFGLFASNVVAAYLFTLTTTFQGFILFVFFVLGNKKTRDLWLNKLKIKQTRKVPVTSSTYTNRSAEWKAVNSPITLEAKASKPKVLSSQDESRFS